MTNSAIQWQKLIVFDLDGTVIDATGKLSVRDLQKLLVAAQAGHVLAVASGRPSWIIPPDLKTCSSIRYIASSSGGELWDRETNSLTYHFLEPETASAVIELADKDRVGVLASGQSKKRMNWKALQTMNQLLKRQTTLSGQLGVSALIVAQLPKLRITRNIMKAFGREQDSLIKLELIVKSEAVLKQLSNALADFTNLTVVKGGRFSIDVTGAGATKGSAIWEICKRTGIHREHVVAFGDGENDLSMRESVGTLVAMGNACPKMKEIADYIAPSITDNGVAYMLKHLEIVPD